MNPVIVVALVAVAGLSITVIYSAIDDGQQLDDINRQVSQKQVDMIAESSAISATITDSNKIKIENLLNDEVTVIQIRVYDDNGNFVKSFPLDETVNGNTDMLLDGLPQELQTMLASKMIVIIAGGLSR